MNRKDYGTCWRDDTDAVRAFSGLIEDFADEIDADRGFRLARDSEARGRSKDALPILLADGATITVAEGSGHKGVGFRLSFTMARG
jgi:hypothetical protein